MIHNAALAVPSTISRVNYGSVVNQLTTPVQIDQVVGLGQFDVVFSCPTGDYCANTFAVCVDPPFPSNEYLIYIILHSVRNPLSEDIPPEEGPVLEGEFSKVDLCPIFFQPSLSPLSAAVQVIRNDSPSRFEGRLQPRGMTLLHEMQHLVVLLGLPRELYICPSASAIYLKLLLHQPMRFLI